MVVLTVRLSIDDTFVLTERVAVLEASSSATKTRPWKELKEITAADIILEPDPPFLRYRVTKDRTGRLPPYVTENRVHLNPYAGS